MKELIISRYNTLSTLFASMFLSIFLLMVRMKLTHSFFFIFLVWNLFLAFVPFAISLYVSNKPNTNQYKLAAISGLWLLFLPNAPYILTDFIHLRLSEPPLLWLDALMIASFAFSGMLYYMYSIQDMKSVLLKKFKPKWVKATFYLLPFLVAFGIYLGRFMRYNSWDIVHQPFGILANSLKILINPIVSYKIWAFTIGLGGFLLITQKVFSKLKD